MHAYEMERLLKKAEKTEDEELLYLIKKLIKERDYLNNLVNKDALTGLNNRRVLKNIKNFSAAVMCDIDNYKHVNDSFGHTTGDSIIKILSSIIKRNIREKDYVCRYGGDEFLIVFIDCPEDIVHKRIEVIRQIAESSIQLPNNEKITMSFGIAFNEDSKNLAELINKADVALYQSKENGKNKITDFAGNVDKIKKYKFTFSKLFLFKNIDRLLNK